MSDNHNDHLTEPHSPGELLDELGSLKALLDEEHESALPYTSVNEISSVEDYLQLKQQADSAGMDIDAYLHQQAEPQAEQAEQAEEYTVEGLEPLDNDDESIPLIDEVFFIEEESEEDGDALLQQVADEEERSPPSTEEATTVEEYFAAVAAAKHRATTPSPAAVPAPQIPLLDKVVEQEAIVEVNEEPSLLEEVNAFDAIPTLEEVVDDEDAIPVLDELADDTSADVIDGRISLDDMQQLVDLIVSRKLEHIKGELEKEVMGELQKLLPLSTFTKP